MMFRHENCAGICKFARADIVKKISAEFSSTSIMVEANFLARTPILRLRRLDKSLHVHCVQINP